MPQACSMPQIAYVHIFPFPCISLPIYEIGSLDFQRPTYTATWKFNFNKISIDIDIKLFSSLYPQNFCCIGWGCDWECAYSEAPRWRCCWSRAQAWEPKPEINFLELGIVYKTPVTFLCCMRCQILWKGKISQNYGIHHLKPSARKS